MTRVLTITRMFAAVAALGLGLAALPAVANDATPTTGSHIDPNARPQMLETIIVPGGAIEAARAVPLDASEARAAQRPQIGEVDAAEWLPTAEINPSN